MSYVDGFVVAVPTANRDAYRDLAARAAEVFLENGALQVFEAWGDDVPHGKQTDFHMAVQAGPDETVVFSWILWPSRAARDMGMPKAMADARLQPSMTTDVFDGKRMIYGGFATLLDERAA